MKDKRQLLERGKTLLILLLSCSALFLISRSGFFHGGTTLFGAKEEQGIVTATRPQEEGRGDIDVVPSGLLIQNQAGRYGIQYDTEKMSQLFEGNLGNRLREAVSGITSAKPISEEVFKETLLSGDSWVFYQFSSDIPLKELSAWLSGERENPSLSGSVSALLLQGDGDYVVLSYKNEEDGTYYSSEKVLSRDGQLLTILESFSPNGVTFAFEEKNVTALDPYAFVFTQMPQFNDYNVKNPFADLDTQEFRLLLSELSFNPKANSYQTNDTITVMEGLDRLYLFGDGTIKYEGRDRENPRYATVDTSRISQVEYAKWLLDTITADRLGDARVYLIRVAEMEDKIQVEFGYTLSGVPVQILGDNYGAQFAIQDGMVTDFTVKVRSYEKLESISPLLPLQQAIAAFGSYGQKEGTLQLSYLDLGKSTVASISWIAV